MPLRTVLVLSLALPSLAHATQCEVNRSVLAPWSPEIVTSLDSPNLTAWPEPTTYGSCTPGTWGLGQDLWVLTCPHDGVIEVQIEGTDCNPDLFVLGEDPSGCAPDATCLESSIDPVDADTAWLRCLAGQIYYVSVENGPVPSAPAHAHCALDDQVDYTLRVRGIEDCSDSTDNDGDGDVDALDDDCAHVGSLELALPDVVLEGTLLTLEATGATPGATVHFGVQAGVADGPGVCPPALGGGCLALDAPRLLGSSIADPTGQATLSVAVPANLPEVVTFQAAEGAGGAAQIAPRVVRTVD